MQPIDVQPFTDALLAHNYVLLGALVVGLLVALMKQGWLSRALAAKVPAAALPFVSVGIGSLGVTSAEIVAGKDAKLALAHGVVAGLLAVFGHEIVIEGMRGGDEIVPERAAPSGKLPPPPPLPVLVLVGLLSFGTGAVVETRADHAPIVVTDTTFVAMHRTAAPLSELQGCHATAEQWTLTGVDTLDLANCVLSKVLGGVVDIISLLGCANATEQLVIQIIDDFQTKAQQSIADAGDGAADAATITPADAGPLMISVRPYYSPQQFMWLALAKQNAVASMALKRAGGK